MSHEAHITDLTRNSVVTDTTITESTDNKSQHNPKKYQRQKMPKFSLAQIKRFWDFVDVGIPSECWPWRGGVTTAKHSKPYGIFHHSKEYPRLRPHRISRTLLKGPFPDELDLDHVYELCSDTLCCNPDHTEPVTTGINVKRYYLSRTHCKRGHPITQHGKPCTPCRTLKKREERARKSTITEAPIAALIH